LAHQIVTVRWFKSPNQDKAVGTFTLYEKIQQPVNAIIQVNVQRSGRIDCDKLPSPAPKKSVTRLVIVFRVSLGLDYSSRSLSPNELASDQGLRTGQGVRLKEWSGDSGHRSTFGVRLSAFNVRRHF
jgi:hypothetical protein